MKLLIFSAIVLILFLHINQSAQEKFLTVIEAIETGDSTYVKKNNTQSKVSIKNNNKRSSYQTIDMNDTLLLTKTINAESRGDTVDCYYVCQVIINRAVAWNKSITDVVYQKNQFPSTRSMYFRYNPNDEYDVHCYNVAKAALSNSLPDNRIIPSNVLYFYNPKVAGYNTFFNNLRSKNMLVFISSNNHHYFSHG